MTFRTFLERAVTNVVLPAVEPVALVRAAGTNRCVCTHPTAQHRRDGSCAHCACRSSS